MSKVGIKTLSDLKGRCYINEDGMWIWKSATTRGRPTCWYAGKTMPAARLAYMLRHKKTEADMAGLDVWAGTGVQLDINPDTAMCGTRGERTRWHCARDPMAAVRGAAAFKRYWDKRGRRFTPEQVAQIRQSTLSEVKESLRWGCDSSTIGRIRRGQAYRNCQTGASVFNLVRSA